MEKLTSVEEETLQAVWRAGQGNIKAILENLPSPVPYTTVASTVKNLERKGYLVSEFSGYAYTYRPALSEEAYKKMIMSGMVKEYFNSSYGSVVNFFISQQKLSASELKEIISVIEMEAGSPTPDILSRKKI